MVLSRRRRRKRVAAAAAAAAAASVRTAVAIACGHLFATIIHHMLATPDAKTCTMTLAPNNELNHHKLQNP